MKISDLIVNFIADKGVEHVFGYIGGAITHIVDSIDKNNRVKFVQTYHEQTASISAEGYARSTNKIGVAIATSGPGATNLITGIADAFFDSIPVIYITGQVNSYEYKYDKPIRQQGFQEMDVISVVQPITKYAKLVDDPKRIIFELEKAYQIAISGRPGPVFLDIPMNVQRTEVNTSELASFVNTKIVKEEFKLSSYISTTLSESQKPVILIGGGMKNLDLQIKSYFYEYLKESQIPVICSLMGKGFFPEDEINFVGMVGSYGNRCANMSIANSDLLIALGSRLDTRQTGAKLEDFLTKGKIIQVDIDNNELVYHRIKDKININADVNDFVVELLNMKTNISNFWLNHISELKGKYNQDQEIERFVENKSPYRLFQTINKLSTGNDTFVGDVGQNQMWLAQTIKVKNRQSFYVSGGLAPMGFSIPFSIGYSFGNRESRVFSVSGDGGFHMSTQALMLISQYNLPIKTIVINNSALGMITQFQGLYFNNNLAATTETGGYVVPKISDIAKAYSLDYYRLEEEDLDKKGLLHEIFNNNKPCIVEYITNGLTTVSPKLEYDSPIHNPSPKLDELEIKSAFSE